MIVAVVTAIAITQREAKREQAAKEAEAKEAAKKDILVVGAGITGLLAALFCRAQGFSVTIVDAKSPEEFDATDSGIVWLAPTALRVLERLHERFPAELRKAACNSEVVTPHPDLYIVLTPIDSQIPTVQVRQDYFVHQNRYLPRLYHRRSP